MLHFIVVSELTKMPVTSQSQRSGWPKLDPCSDSIVSFIRRAVLGGSWVLITTITNLLITYMLRGLRGLVRTVITGYKYPEPPSREHRSQGGSHGPQLFQVLTIPRASGSVRS